MQQQKTVNPVLKKGKSTNVSVPSINQNNTSTVETQDNSLSQISSGVPS